MKSKRLPTENVLGINAKYANLKCKFDGTFIGKYDLEFLGVNKKDRAESFFTFLKRHPSKIKMNQFTKEIVPNGKKHVAKFKLYRFDIGSRDSD